MRIEDLRLLLVEPSAAQQRILEQQLAGLGVWQIECLDDTRHALERITAEPPDVVFSAMHLNGSSGADLIASMRAQPKSAAIPFVLVSSEQSIRWLEPVRQSGVTAIIRKPCTADDLRRALLRTVELLDTRSLDVGDLDLEGIHALVVDDSRAARRFMVMVLERLGIRRTTEAENGREAVGHLSDTFYDLVVTDYNMPEMNGYELVEYIRTQSSQRSIPVMMVTSEEDETRLAAVHEAGVSALCDKPFETAAVRSLLRGMLRAE